MLHVLDSDLLDFLSIVAANNTPEQMEQAENDLPVKDDVQEQSFALLKQFAEHKQQA